MKFDELDDYSAALERIMRDTNDRMRGCARGPLAFGLLVVCLAERL